MPRLLRSRAFPVFLGGLMVTALGILVGLGSVTFIYARGTSYLSDDPQACANCHVMEEQLDAWLVSSHRNVATCNACHTPQGAIEQWIVKGINGFNHGYAFTTGEYPQVITIREANATIVQANCLACHVALSTNDAHANPDRSCMDCHGNVGHETRSTR